MDDYESTRQRHRARAFERLPDLLGRLTWSGSQLRAWRAARLRDLLAIARERSSWHRARLAGVAIERMDEERLREPPTMTKDDLMAGKLKRFVPL